MKILALVILTLILQSCATFPINSSIKQPLTEANLTELNAQYNVSAEKDSLIDNTYIDLHNAFEKLYRGNGRGNKDTMTIDNLDRYSFAINVIDNRRIEITYLKDKSSFRKFSMKYYSKNDGYLYLKNKNFKISGVPYLFGGIDIKKLRLTNVDNYLIIEEVHHSSGGLLFILGDSKTWTYINKYKRTE